MRPLVSASAAEAPPSSAALAHAATGPIPRWVSLTPRAGGAAADRPIRVGRVVAQVGIAAIVVVCLVGITGSIISRRIAERQSVHYVAQTTDVLADSVVQPALTDAMFTNPALARAVLDPIVRDQLLSSSLIRVKLWLPDGTIVYSDESRLNGRAFELDNDARAALTSPRTEASISDLGRPENQFERSQGKLLEVYRPVWTPSGNPLLFETYFRYDTVTTRSSDLWRGFSGIMLSSLAALFLLL